MSRTMRKTTKANLEVQPGSPAAAWDDQQETISPALATASATDEAKPVESGNSQTVEGGSQGGESSLQAARDKKWRESLAKANQAPRRSFLDPFGFNRK